jgi:hypothetical protein
MANATYSRSSPYFTTGKYGTFLDTLNKRNIYFRKDDVVYTIERAYENRPDLLAYDLYGDAGLWWVFAVRNPNVITDPLGDFVAGITIRIPKKTDLDSALGL